jgi:hypothetical protein
VSESTADGWFYLKDGAAAGQQVGPLPWEDLCALGMSGKLSPADLVWHPQLPQWMVASSIPGLFVGAPVTAAAPPAAGGAGPVVAAVCAPRRRSRLWPVLLPMIGAVLVGAGLGAYFGLRSGDDETGTAGVEVTAGVEATTATTEDGSADLGVAEAADGDPDLVVETETYGIGPADQVLVLMAEGSGRDEAEAVAAVLDGTIVGEVGYIALYQIQTAGTTDEDLTAAIETATAQPGVEAAFPNLIMTTDTTIEGLKCSPLRDPAYDGANGTPYEMIGLQQAWDILKASGVELNHVHVGMVDSPVNTQSGQGFGAELHFPDAAGGYPAGKVQLSGLSAADTTDQLDMSAPGGLSHGTHVAHLIAADDEGGGVVGVLGPAGDDVTLTTSDWTSGTWRWQSPDAEVNDVTVYEGFAIKALVEIKNQVDAGATVINLSLGTFGSGPGQRWLAAAYKRFFEQMQRDKPEVLFVASAGNEGLALDGANHAPGGFRLPNLITVGALDQTGDRATSADWSSPEEIQQQFEQLKAGGSMPDDWDVADYTAWLESRGGSNYAAGDGEVTLSACGTGVPGALDAEGRPTLVDGTSFSAPQVTAAAAMLKAIKPSLTAEEIKQILVETADTEVARADGSKAPVPANVGGRVLRIDKAVLEVINSMLPPSMAWSMEDLLALAAVGLVAEGGPDEYTVTASVARVGDAGVDLTISTTGEGTVTGSATQHLSAAGEVSWTVAPKEGASLFVKVARSDSGACAHLALDRPVGDLAGDWSWTGVMETNGVYGPSDRAYTYTFKEEGGGWALYYEDTRICDVSFDGVNVSFATAVFGTATYAGVLEGDTITGTQVHDGGKWVGAWNATRVR